MGDPIVTVSFLLLGKDYAGYEYLQGLDMGEFR